jgi:hypothetical protein
MHPIHRAKGEYVEGGMVEYINTIPSELCSSPQFQTQRN